MHLSLATHPEEVSAAKMRCASFTQLAQKSVLVYFCFNSVCEKFEIRENCQHIERGKINSAICDVYSRVVLLLLASKRLNRKSRSPLYVETLHAANGRRRGRHSPVTRQFRMYMATCDTRKMCISAK